jgi:HEAT repeat protein
MKRLLTTAAQRSGMLLLGLLAAGLVTAAAQAKEEWYQRLDLEPAVAHADLILVARVTEVGEVKTVHGGKQERVTQQLTFAPLRTLKGVFSRDRLLLTTDDLGNFDEPVAAERGELRLLLLGRSGRGYVNSYRRDTFDESVPPLRDANDPLLAAVKVLIGVTQERDRGRRVKLLLEGLREARGPSAVPLLLGLQRRALLAAQTSGVATAVTRHLGDGAAAVREAAAATTQVLLSADYLEHKELRTSAVDGLAALLGRGDVGLSGRVAALDALGRAGAAALTNDAAVRQLKVDAPRDTFGERAAAVRAAGELKMADQRDATAELLRQLPLDAPYDIQAAAGRALVGLDPAQAARLLMERLKKKVAVGLGIDQDIGLLAELPRDAAAVALLEVIKLDLRLHEKVGFAQACAKVADARLVPALSGLLSPRRPQLRWHAVEALRKINTAEAARALQPHLKEEGDLHRKLQIAELLGRHGLGDGYPYAMEHLSEPHLVDQAVAALAAIRDPQTVPVLRDILKNSNDHGWNSVAIRALGALGEKEFAARFLEIVGDLKHPLAPAALVALGDLGEVKALPRVREGLASRNERVALASARAAQKLLAVPEVKEEALREQLAALLGDADASMALRLAALEALVAVKDGRLDRALRAAVHDAALEGSALLERSERLLRERKVTLVAASR